MDEGNHDPFELDVSNDPEVERLGANAAVQHAVQYWQTLSKAARRDGRLFDPVWEEDDDDNSAHDATPTSNCQHTKEIRFTDSAERDHRLYRRFRSNFGASWYGVDRIPLPPSTVAAGASARIEQHNSSCSNNSHPLAGARWTALLVASDGAVPDYNFLTLLRAHVTGAAFWMTPTAACPGLLTVSRAQFTYLELARCREGCYARPFRRLLRTFDVQTAVEQLEAAVRQQQQQQNGGGGATTSANSTAAALAALLNLQTQWPHPSVATLKVTGAVSTLKRILALTDATLAVVQDACRDQLKRWHDIVALGKLTTTPAVSAGQVRALQRAAKALTTTPVAQENKASAYRTKTTANLVDISVDKPTKRSGGNLFAADNSSESKSSAAANVFRDYGVVVIPNYCSELVVAACAEQSERALERLQSEKLAPRGFTVDGPASFDFVEVRQRPGHRVDNRYGMLDDATSAIAVLGRQLLADLPAQLFDDSGDGSGGGGWKLQYAGVVHAFARHSPTDAAPPPQGWHRDGPSLFHGSHHHPTHCYNVFVPLIDVSAANGATEFVPGTHEDARYDIVAADVVLGNHERTEAAGVVRADAKAGSVIAFDIRVLHRGLSNESLATRPVLYYTFGRDWFAERHMFQQTESLVRSTATDSLVASYAQLCREFYRTVTGKTPRENGGMVSYGHPHYTTRFDLLLLEQLTTSSSSIEVSFDPSSQNDHAFAAAAAIANCAAVLQFCNADDRDALCAEFVDALESEQALERKCAALLATRQARRQQKEEQQQDFASIQTDMTDVAALYQLTARLLFEDTNRLSKLGFAKDEQGACTVLALLKAHATSSEVSLVSAARLEECFTSWWNAASSRSRFELMTSAQGGPEVSQRKLLVVFSSLGSGIARPEWRGTLKAIGAIPRHDLDVLHVMDFASSWYCQDPRCEWKGGEYYEEELKKRTEQYHSVFFLGDSMGAAGALRFSTLADTVLAFTPQVDLSNYEALTRTDFTTARRRQFQNEVIGAVRTSKASITVHYGGQCEEDVRHVRLLPQQPTLLLVEHEYDDHILSLHLRDEGKLTNLVGDALQQFLGKQ